MMSARPFTPKFEVRNPKSDVAGFPRHDRFAPLLYRVVASGLSLGAVVFLVNAFGVMPDAMLFATGTVAATALVAVAFVLQQVLVAFRPWRRLTAALGIVLLFVLVVQLALRIAAALGDGVPPLSSPALELASFAYGVLAAGLLLAYLSCRLNEIYGLVGALLFLSTPPLLLPATTGLPLVFYASAALLCLFLWGETGGLSWLIAAGLGTGFTAAGLSWKAALFVLACGLVVALAVARRDRGWRAKVVSALVLLSSGMAPYASWEAIAWIWAAEGARAHALVGDAIGTGPSPDAIGPMLCQGILHAVLALPLGEARPPHALIAGPAAVCFLPWAFRGKWPVEKRVLLLVALAFLLAGGYGGALKSLGLLPIIPLLATLAAYGVHNLYMSVRRPAWLFATAGILLAWNGLIVWSTIV